MRPELWICVEGKDGVETLGENVKTLWLRWSDVRRVGVTANGKTLLLVDGCDEVFGVDKTPAELFEMARKSCEEHS